MEVRFMRDYPLQPATTTLCKHNLQTLQENRTFRDGMQNPQPWLLTNHYRQPHDWITYSPRNKLHSPGQGGQRQPTTAVVSKH